MPIARQLRRSIVPVDAGLPALQIYPRGLDASASCEGSPASVALRPSI